MLLNLLLALLNLSTLSANKLQQRNTDHQDGPYPSRIPYYPIRIDEHSKQPVSRGRIKLHHRHSEADISIKKVTYNTFRKSLQCVPHEPALERMNLFRLFPITRRTLELVAVWMDFGCDRRWGECSKTLEAIHAGRKKFKLHVGQAEENNFLRVNSGGLFYDWPQLNLTRQPHIFYSEIIDIILSKVSDIKDSVFLFFVPHPEVSDDWPLLAFPNFCQGIHRLSSSVVSWPWSAHFNFERENVHTDDFNKTQMKAQWHLLSSKAVVLGAISPLRYPAFMMAASRPDLFTSGWYATNTASLDEIRAFNPLSTEERLDLNERQTSAPDLGMLSSLRLNQITDRTSPKTWEDDHSHKYIVVMIGSHGRADSDRLARLLSTSGAVILIQDHDFESYFSQRLIPWVHFVPLLHSMTDLVEKVTWLREHDDFAYRIAINARNFGKSYLRLEDILCYGAAALHTLGEIYSNPNSSSALEHFSSVDLSHRLKWDIKGEGLEAA